MVWKLFSKELFKPHAQRILHLLLSEMCLVGVSHTSLENSILIMKELKRHLNPIDLQRYICILIYLISSVVTHGGPEFDALETMLMHCMTEVSAYP